MASRGVKSPKKNGATSTSPRCRRPVLCIAASPRGADCDSSVSAKLTTMGRPLRDPDRTSEVASFPIHSCTRTGIGEVPRPGQCPLERLSSGVFASVLSVGDFIVRPSSAPLQFFVST